MLPIFRLKVLTRKERNSHISDEQFNGWVSGQCAKIIAMRVRVEREVWQYHNLLGEHIQATASHTLALHNILYISHNTAYQQSLV